MQRLIFVLTVALLMAAMVVATAMPAFAGAIKFSTGPCGDVCAQGTVTPSENINLHQASHPNP
jgi:hypothetical protein